MKNKQAVAIAKDVIAQLKTKQLVAESGFYLHTDTPFREGDLQSQLKSMDKAGKRCRACAVGGMFVAMVKRYDKFTVVNKLGYNGIDYKDVLRFLESAFSPAELKSIEACFEAYEIESIVPGSLDIVTKLMASVDDRLRLQIIMEEIIRQQGEFYTTRFARRLEDMAIQARIALAKKGLK